MFSCKDRCNKCGYEFWIEIGGTMLANQLRCDLCGESKLVDAPDSRLYPREKRLAFSSDKERDEYLEKKAGKCICGGQFKYGAPARCPECGATDITELEDEEGIWSD